MRDEFESEIAGLVQAGSFDLAATRILEVYGPELFGFLVNTLASESDAGEVFSQAAEDLWKGLPKFKFRCSVRTWIYVVGRHAASRYRRSPWNRAERRGGDSRIQSAIDVARSRTQPWQRTEVKDKMRALRDSLDEEDRMLLTLRIDRDMAWEDVARVMLGGDGEGDGDDIDPKVVARETDRLRKRFQLLKGDLRKRAAAVGLLDEP